MKTLYIAHSAAPRSQDPGTSALLARLPLPWKRQTPLLHSSSQVRYHAVPPQNRTLPPACSSVPDSAYTRQRHRNYSYHSEGSLFASRIPPLRSRKHEQLFTNALTHSISCDTIITRIVFRVFIVIIASTVFRVNRFL